MTALPCFDLPQLRRPNCLPGFAIRYAETGTLNANSKLASASDEQLALVSCAKRPKPR